MPRELGKARSNDLVGNLPGESGDHVADLSAFLQGSGQMQSPEQGSYLDAPSNGSGSDTEIGRGTDTEVAPAVSHYGGNGFGGNGHGSPEDTVFDTPLASFDNEMGFGDMQEMTPDLSPGPLLTPEPLTPQALTPQPAAAKPLAPQPLTPQPPQDLSPQLLSIDEPQSLESVPDLTSPELDEPLDEDHTELPPVRQKTNPIGSDTGILEMVGKPVEEAERINFDDLAPPDSEQRAEEETSLKEEGAESEKITSKVDPRRDIDPRTGEPHGVMRDTVNFYNQTQSLHQERQPSPAGSGQRGFPTISPNVVNSAAPIDLRPELQQRAPVPEPSLLASDESDTLVPLNADPELASLVADSDVDDADRRDTDRFMDDDRRPPQLPVPVGVGAAGGPISAGAPRELNALSDERTAAGKDTQRFYVAEIMKPAALDPADSTDELQPADSTVPKAPPSGDTAPDYTSASEAATRIAYRKPEPLPQPGSVKTDFLERPYSTAAERLVPGLEDDESQKPTDRLPERKPDRITEKVLQQAETAQAAMRPAASERPSRPQPQPVRQLSPAIRAPQPAAASRAQPSVGSGRQKRVSDSMSRRLRAERDETLKLIEAAEAVARRLRLSSESARADLAVLSTRRSAVPEAEAEGSELAEAAAERSAGSETVSDARADTDTSVRKRARGTSDARETTVAEASVDWYGDADPDTPDPVAPDPLPGPAPSRRRERVPTRAIGEILDEIESKLQTGPALSDLLSEASARLDATPPPPAPETDQDDDLDMWVAASGRLREIVESDWQAGREDAHRDDESVSRREPAAAGTNGGSHNGENGSNGSSGRLSADMEKLWHELDSRREVTVLPRSGKPRIVPASHELPAHGWSQEAMWQTLVGIAAVTFVLGAFFVWLLHRLVG